jgi:hypothetical protein
MLTTSSQVTSGTFHDGHYMSALRARILPYLQQCSVAMVHRLQVVSAREELLQRKPPGLGPKVAQSIYPHGGGHALGARHREGHDQA